MPIKINIEYTSKGTKKLAIEYSRQLDVVKRKEPVNFDAFLAEIEADNISISYFGHGPCSVLEENEHHNPPYEVLKEFLKKPEKEFFKLQGTVKATIDDKLADMDFYMESEISKFAPYDLRLQANAKVAEYLQDLLNPEKKKEQSK
jgi:hypothetical protein